MFNENCSFGKWLRHWLIIYKKPNIKSWHNIKINIRLHIPDYIKNTKLKDLSVIDIQKAINDVELSRTRLDVYDIYHGSLTMAYHLDFIKKDIASLLIRPKHIRNNGTALTKDELLDFLIAIKGHRLEFFYRFLLLTGVRRSEGLNLCVEDINFNTNTIHIKGTKTSTSDRYIPITEELRSLLILHSPFKNKKVFSHSPSYVSHTFTKFCSKHKLHDLRHTFATRCLECRINIKVVQSWLGHSRLDTTAMIYSHVLPEFQFLESKKFSLL